MTALAGGREGPVADERFAVRPRPRLVARRAGHGRVRPFEFERGVAIVIKAPGRRERIHRMAALAAGAVGELPGMRIAVAVGAPHPERRQLHRSRTRSGEQERGAPRLSSLQFLVTPDAGNRTVGALQGEAEPLVSGRGDRCGPEPSRIVATGAAGRPRGECRAESALMRVRVACPALDFLQPERDRSLAQ